MMHDIIALPAAVRDPILLSNLMLGQDVGNAVGHVPALDFSQVSKLICVRNSCIATHVEIALGSSKILEVLLVFESSDG